MKKIMLFAVIASASVCTAYAQGQKTNQAPPQTVKVVDQKSYEAKQAGDWDTLVKTELKLTNEHSTKIAVINSEFNQKKQAIVNDASLSDDAKKEKKEALEKRREAKFAEVLTLEQQAKYKQLSDAKIKAMEMKKETPNQ